MKYPRVKQPRISDMVMQQLESMILDGTFNPGQKLPPERELAIQFEVSRPSLREAIQKLVARGFLYSRQGGGTYVVEEIGHSFSDPLLQLLSSHDEFKYDLLEFRDALEGVSAYYAALRSTPEDKQRITQHFDSLLAIYENMDPELEAEAEADAAFHLAIAEAAHNVILLHTMRGLFNLLKESIVANLSNLFEKRESRPLLKAQHQALYDAIMNADPERAQQAAHEHLAFVEDSLLELSRMETRKERALRRARVLNPSTSLI
ncbi:GntR family transcriptional regulator [Allopseudospirillum japonicum]|nr:GntR family transcriptional regulator [Allopseudospirillum japonicum]